MIEEKTLNNGIGQLDKTRKKEGVSMGDFREGDIVQLKSGGPRMTIKILENCDVYCQWFSSNKLQTGVFHKKSIAKAEEELVGV